MKKVFISLLLLVLVSAVSVMAQKRADVRSNVNRDSVGDTIDDGVKGMKWSGKQTAEGADGPAETGQYKDSYMFVSGESVDNYSLSTSHHYYSQSTDPHNYGVEGGNWTISVFRDGVQVGTIFGDTVGGNSVEIVDGNGDLVSRTVNLKFQIMGGTGEWEQVDTQEDAICNLEITVASDLQVSAILRGFRKL